MINPSNVWGLLPRSSGIPSSIFRRHPYIFLAATTFVLSVIFYGYHYEPFQPLPRQSHPPGHGAFDGRWNFTRDARNLLLNDTQCDQAFPDLFLEIDRAVNSRRNHHITRKEIDEVGIIRGYIRAMLYDQQLYVLGAGLNVNSRDQATLHALHRAILTSPEPLPNIEFTFLADDIAPPQTRWAYSRPKSDEKLWLIPDFGYWSWPEPKIGAYSEVQMKAVAMDKKVPWRHKIDKLVWRGAMMDLEVRENLLEVTATKDWADVRILSWEDEAENKSQNVLSMAEHCQYKFVAHTEGVSYSARLQNLQNCDSVVVAHKLKWIQHHHHLMVSSGPEQNFVEVALDFSDLESTMEKLQKNDWEAQRIAANSVRMFRERYLTPAAETCYWRKLIRGWAKVSFEPEFFDTSSGEAKWRGLPVESFMLERRMDWLYY